MNHLHQGLELARRLNYHRPELDTLARFFHLGKLSAHQRELLGRELAPVFAMAREHPEMALFDCPSSTGGELVLGELPNGSPMHIPVDMLATGALLLGTTGSGKTNLLRAFMNALCDYAKHRKIAAWIVDHQKPDQEASIAIAASHSMSMASVPIRFPFNPLDPQGLSVTVWASRALAILVFALRLSEITALYLRPIIHQLYQKSACPTWSDLMRAVEEELDIPESVRRPLLKKLQGLAIDLPDLVETEHGLPIEELEARWLYWPLYRLPSDHARLIYSWARWASFTRRTENRISPGTPDLFVIEDELSFAYDQGSDNDFLSKLLAVQRSTGIAFVGANQNFQLLPQVLANTNLKIIGRLGSSTDVREASDLLTLSPEQRDWLLLHPLPGDFIVKMPSGHVQPFPFRARRIDVSALPEGDRLKAEQSLIDDLKEQVTPISRTVPREIPSPPSAARPTDDSRTLLESCHAQPFLYHSQRAKVVGLNNNRMNRLKKELLAQEFVIEHQLETCKPGARPKLLEITQKGCETINKAFPSWRGRPGGFLHHFGKDVVAAYYADKGFSITVEVSLGKGQSVDVLAVSEQERVGIEIQTTDDHAIENVQKLLGRVSRIELVCFHAPVKNRLEQSFLGQAGIGVNHFSFYTKDLHRF